MPGVVEGGDLGIGGETALILEEDIIGSGRVEGRIQINEIHRIGRHGAQDGEVITKIEGIGHDLIVYGYLLNGEALRSGHSLEVILTIESYSSSQDPSLVEEILH